MPSKAKIDRLNKLIAKYCEGKATPEEVAFVEKYYQYFDHNSNLTSLLSESEIDQVRQRMLDRVKEEIALGKNLPVAANRNRWIAGVMAAAAIIVIVGGGVLFLRANMEKALPIEEKTVVATGQDDIAPGGNKAMITLEDGSRILLDNSANGTISQQGSMQVVKLSNGEIVYKKKDNHNHNDKVFINTMTTPRGGQYQLTLADGTKVWMNSESSITYPTAFKEREERKVKISGEVYFEVATLPIKGTHENVPFIVLVDSPGENEDMEIQVLGTHFNVNTYADNGSSLTTLLEGLVRIKNNKEEQILKPGQQAQVGNTIRVNDKVDTDLVMAWKNGLFSFNNTSLDMVMKQLTRWYDVDVVYEDKKPDMKFWGGISMNSNLSQVLMILQESKVKFRIENKKIIVLSN